MTIPRWAPPAAWAAVILTATSIPNIHVSGPEGSDKVAHFSMYFILGFLALRAFANALTRRSVVGAFIALSCFGALDELHQILIPGRSADVMDWAADTGGATAGASLALLLLSLRGARV
jgi:VanZ family protein